MQVCGGDGGLLPPTSTNMAGMGAILEASQALRTLTFQPTSCPQPEDDLEPTYPAKPLLDSWPRESVRDGKS